MNCSRQQCRRTTVQAVARTPGAVRKQLSRAGRTSPLLLLLLSCCRLCCSTTLGWSSWRTRPSSRRGTLRRSSTASSTPSTGGGGLVCGVFCVYKCVRHSRCSACSLSGASWAASYTPRVVLQWAAQQPLGAQHGAQRHDAVQAAVGSCVLTLARLAAALSDYALNCRAGSPCAGLALAA